MRLAAILLVLAALVLPAAEESAALAAARKALAGDDPYAKRDAMKALAAAAAGDDETVLPVLVQAVGDRQAADAAVAALRQRTGLAGPTIRGARGYPNYPSADTAAGWGEWLAARAKAKSLEKKVEQIAKPAGSTPAASQAASTPGAEAPAEAPAASPAAPVVNAPIPDDLGKLDRVVFKRGGSLVCFVRTKRIDADGNLISVRVVYPDNQGEEVIDAKLIARIEEDIE